MLDELQQQPSHYKIIFAILGASIIVIIGISLWLFVWRTSDGSTVPNTTSVAGAEEKLLPSPLDTDRDTLSDAEEKRLGTNPQQEDTDGDGLSDATEVQKTKTDPLRPRSKDPTLTDQEWARKQ